MIGVIAKLKISSQDLVENNKKTNDSIKKLNIEKDEIISDNKKELKE